MDDSVIRPQPAKMSSTIDMDSTLGDSEIKDSRAQGCPAAAASFERTKGGN